MSFMTRSMQSRWRALGERARSAASALRAACAICATFATCVTRAARTVQAAPALLVRLCGLRLATGSLAALALAVFTVPLPLAGCGGGVGEEGTGYASGPINGFGSVIVNDITFDDSAAVVEDGEGFSRLRAELRLGMTVEVESGVIRSGSARAIRVRFDAALRGPVERVEADGFVVLGQRVQVDETTVYEGALAAGLAAITPGQTLEVYALFDSGTARYRATRVERRLVAPLYRLRGVVAEIQGNTLRIGNALFAFGAAANVPSDLAVGSFVRLFVANDPDAFGRWPVLRFGEVHRSLVDVADVSVKGFVTSLASLADLRVDGRPVDARGAVIEGGPLAPGLRVEVAGSLRGGVLVATRVSLRSDQFERDRGFELRGPIEQVAANTSLVLRGVTVGLTDPRLRYEGGAAADLAVGREVEVRGVVSRADGARLDALLVRFR
jgi:hypothetical protein